MCINYNIDYMNDTHHDLCTRYLAQKSNAISAFLRRTSLLYVHVSTQLLVRSSSHRCQVIFGLTRNIRTEKV